MENKIKALSEHLEMMPTCEHCGHDEMTEEQGYTCDDCGKVSDIESAFPDIQETSDNVFSADGGEYYVLTDLEADEIWDEYLDQYIDDCVLPELSEAYRFYFDDEAFKRDLKMDGRAHSLASYDGNEHEIEIDGEYFYIYRVN